MVGRHNSINSSCKRKSKQEEGFKTKQSSLLNFFSSRSSNNEKIQNLVDHTDTQTSTNTDRLVSQDDEGVILLDTIYKNKSPSHSYDSTKGTNYDIIPNTHSRDTIQTSFNDEQEENLSSNCIISQEEGDNGEDTNKDTNTKEVENTLEEKYETNYSNFAQKIPNPITPTLKSIPSNDSTTKKSNEIQMSEDFHHVNMSTTTTAATNYNDEECRELSEYEKLRLRNMKRNHDRLVQLGLATNNELTSSSISSKPLCITNNLTSSCTKSNFKTRKRPKPSLSESSPCDMVNGLNLRRSTRTRRLVSSSSEVNIDVDMVADKDNHLENKENMDDNDSDIYVSSSLKNVMLKNTNRSGNSLSENKVKSFHYDEIMHDSSFQPNVLIPPQGLSSIYSIDIYPNHSCNSIRDLEVNGDDDNDDDYNSTNQKNTWVVGAGKSGIVSIWNYGSEPYGNKEKNNESNNIEQELNNDPILTWKCHGGRWIADARFLPPSTTNRTSSSSLNSNHDYGSSALTERTSDDVPTRLITAANDGCVCLWDLTSTSSQTGIPKCMSNTGKSLHKSGIFAMDVLVPDPSQFQTNDGDILICTGSKDKSIIVTSLEDIVLGSKTKSAGYQPIYVSKYHQSKVSGVAMCHHSNSPLLGSTSDDGSMVIHDYKRGKIVEELHGIHEKPHSFVWHPKQENLFITAGHDNKINLFDLRCLKEPLHVFYGHVPDMTTRFSKIHRPTFFSSPKLSQGGFILTGGQGSFSLSTYLYNHGFQMGTSQHSSVSSQIQTSYNCGSDVGCIAVGNEKDNIFVALDGGAIISLSLPFDKTDLSILENNN